MVTTIHWLGAGDTVLTIHTVWGQGTLLWDWHLHTGTRRCNHTNNTSATQHFLTSATQHFLTPATQHSVTSTTQSSKLSVSYKHKNYFIFNIRQVWICNAKYNIYTYTEHISLSVSAQNIYVQRFLYLHCTTPLSRRYMASLYLQHITLFWICNLQRKMK